MLIAELFRSLQGEGILTGTPSVFVRVAGCNLRCWFCDTPYASWNPEGEEMAVEEIAARAESHGDKHIVITGGEPMIYPDVVRLTQMLKERDRHITVETSGTVYQPVACDLMSISPKLSSSVPLPELGPDWRIRHEQTRHAPDVIRRLVAEYPYQFKFVIDRMEDCAEVDQYLIEFPEIDRQRVMLMPQGADTATLDRHMAWLKPYCRDHGMKLCPRRQIEWFGTARGV